MDITVNYIYQIKCVITGNRANSDAYVATYPEILSMDDAVAKARRIINEYNLDSLFITDAETGEILIECTAEKDTWEDSQAESRRYLYAVPTDIEDIKAAYKVGDHIRIGWIVGEVNAFGHDCVYIESGISPDHIPHGFDQFFFRSYVK